jgi:hypothetical protein
MKFKVGDIVKVLYAPRRCETNWPGMVGHVGFIEQLHFDDTRALVRTVTIDGRHHRLAFMGVWALEPVNNPAWSAAVEIYRRNEGVNMSEQPNKPINPFEAAKQVPGIHAKIDVHDVQKLRPDISEARARGFLLLHRHAIAHAMLLAGTQTIRALLENRDAN